MIPQPPQKSNSQTDSPPVSLAGPAHLIAIAVGNTRTRIGLFHHAELAESVSLNNEDLAAIEAQTAQLLAKQVTEEESLVVIASVKPSISESLAASLGKAPGAKVFVIGQDLPIHINHVLDEDGAKTVGQDRLLNALGAFSRTGQATVVVDAGTAITVDFVDGEGTFYGGAIAPGLNMMLAALHENTEQLPLVKYEPMPEGEAFGLSTPAAINLGIVSAIQGMVRVLTERYAEAYGGYPQIVATGGDLGLLESEGVIEHFVPDLQLIGIQVACARALVEADLSHDD